MNQYLERYSQFGKKVQAVILTHMRHDGRISELLTHLNLPVSGDIQDQHYALGRFLFQYGGSFFITAMEAQSREEVEGLKARHMLQGFTAMAAPSTARPQTRPGNTPAPVVVTPQPRETPAATPLPVDLPPGVYTGRERRSGAERRQSNQDRRTEVELIYRNRRFGGRERRKATRRACEQTDAEKSA
jgi:hypothetical protein